MARNAGSDAKREALDRLKERRDRETRGYTEFFAVEDRRRRLTEELEGLDVEQAKAVATIAEVSDVATIAEVTEWSLAKVRAAVKLGSNGDGDGDGDSGVHTAAVVAS